jgi:DNA-binding NarL/FixJ family response regulator
MTVHVEAAAPTFAPRLRGVPTQGDRTSIATVATVEAPRRLTAADTERGELAVMVQAADWLSRAGVEHLLRDCPRLSVVTGGADVDVVLLVSEHVDEPTLREVRSLRAQGCRVVLVLQVLDDPGLLAAVEAGASALLLRAHATPDVLERSIRSAAAGDGSLPPDLLGRLMAQVQAVQQQVLAPRGLTWGALSARETDVLRLIADGFDTAEVARTLSWSERTVKNVVHDITTRLHLRNRAHAVAYAVRHGLI